jgi:hypothetical protein
MSALEQQLSILGITLALVLVAMYVEYRQTYPPSKRTKKVESAHLSDAPFELNKSL